MLNVVSEYVVCYMNDQNTLKYLMTNLIPTANHVPGPTLPQTQSLLLGLLLLTQSLPLSQSLPLNQSLSLAQFPTLTNWPYVYWTIIVVDQNNLVAAHMQHQLKAIKSKLSNIIDFCFL